MKKQNLLFKNLNALHQIGRRSYLGIMLAASLFLGLTGSLSATIIQVGTGTVAPSVGSNPGSGANGASPYGICVGSGSMGKKVQIIYTAAQINTAMTAAGYTPGTSFINTVSWDVSSNVGGSNYNHLGYTIKMANVPAFTAFTGTTPYAGAMTTVWGATNQQYGASGTGYLITHTLLAPFQWDGTSSLVVEVCYTITGVGLASTYGACRRTATVGNQMIYNGGAAINCATASYATAVAAIPNVKFDVTPATPCTGFPATATAETATTCPNTSTNLGLTGLVGASGYTYLWKYSSNIGGPYASASGTNTNATYDTPNTLPSNPAYYICEVTCSGNMTPSNPGTVTLANFLTCYCTTGFSNAAATAARGLTRVTLVGNSVTINNATAANLANPSPYNLYSTPVADITAGLGYTLFTMVGSQASNNYVAAWIDYDQDGYFGGYTSGAVFNATGDYNSSGIIERIASVGPTNANIASGTAFTVPATATAGNTAMRVRYRYNSSLATWGSCQQLTGTATSGGAGEVEDYRVNIIPGCTAPTGATASSAGSLTPTSAVLSWTNGTGTGGRIVLLKQGTVVNAAPVSGTSYTDNLTFGSGSQIGTGNYVVYDGTGSSSGTINGLLPSTTYYYSVYEYNSASTCYVLTGETGNFTTSSCSPTLQASSALICAEYTSLNLSFNRGNGDRTLVVAKAVTPVDAAPVYNTSYTASPIFGSGTQLGTGNFVVYNGNSAGSASVTVTGLTQGVTYNFKFYEYFESPNCYNLSAVPSINGTTRNAAVYTSSTTTQVSTTVAQNSLAQQVVALQVVMGGGVDPAATMNSITFNTTGCTNTGTDITTARIYYTGTSSTFSNATQYGSTFTSFAGNLTATDNFALSAGINYFWIAYDMNLTATVSNVIDATVVSFNITDNSGTSTQIPSVTAPPGSRSIVSSSSTYCTAGTRTACGLQEITVVELAGTAYPIACAGAYNNYTAATPANVNAGGIYNLKVGVDDWIVYAGCVAWIDWNQNGTFETTERYPATPSTYLPNGSNYSITVPCGAITGSTRMRVYTQEDGSFAGGNNPCRNSMGSLTTHIGQICDYTVNILPNGGCGTPGGAVQAVSCATLVPTGTAPVTYAKGDTPAQLTATGTSLLWYTAATGGVGSATAPTPSTAVAGTTSYYVTQNTGCESPRTQIAVTVTTSCGPISYAVTGGSNCISTTVGLTSSQVGVSYQLLLDGTPLGSPIAGTGAALNFGVKTTPGVYTIVGTDLQPASTIMGGNATVWASPTAVISGTLLGCLPGGVSLGITGSAAGSGSYSSFQWQQNGVDIALATGTNYNATVSDNYSVVITNSNGCSTTSAASGVIVNTPPTAAGSGPLVTCENLAITVSGVTTANGTISWAIFTGNGSLTNTGTLTPTYTPDASDAGTTVVLRCTVTNPPCADVVLNQQIIIRPRPVLSAATINICTGNPVAPITVPSPAANTDYKWTPINDLYLDAALTMPYTLGTPATAVWTAPFGAITYNVSATNTIDGCVTGTTPVSVTVCPALTNGICDADVATPINVTITPTFNVYSLTGATSSGGVSCAPIARDIWYRAQVPANGELHVITKLHNNPTAALNIQSSVVTIFTGASCSSVASVVCNSNGAAGDMSYTHASGLTSGTYAYIRLASTTANLPAAQFIKMAVTSGLIWTAAVDDDFNNPANWHGGDATAITVPSATRSVIIPANLTQPKLYANTFVKGVTLSTFPPYYGSAALNLNAFTLNVKGNWGLIGNTNATTTLDCNGTVEFNGTEAQTIGLGKTTFGNLTTNNPTFGVSLSSTTGASCILKSTAGNFNTNGFLTLKSTATTTALVNPMAGIITGNVSVERKNGAISGYHYLSSPVSGAFVNNTISGWRDDFTIDAAADNMIFIPGSQPTSLFATVWEYNETVNNPNPAYGYVGATAGDDPITPLKGFACIVPANVVVDVKGPLNNGAITPYGVTFTDDGLNLVGNPYPSPISWESFRTTNPSLSATYQAFISTGSYAGSYGTWTATTPGNGVGTLGLTNTIASSQAFMVNTGSTTTITAANSNRIVTPAGLSATFFNSSDITPNLFRMDLAGNGFADQMVVYFGNNTSDNFSMNEDANKLFSPVEGPAGIYTTVNNHKMAMNAMGQLSTDKVVALGVKTALATTYQLSTVDLSSFDASVMVYLEDTQLGITTNLRLTPNYTVDLPSGEINNRFFLHFHPAVTLAATNETCAGNDGSLTINYPSTSTVSVVVKNAAGVVVSTQPNFTGSATINNLVAGNYAVDMSFGIAPSVYTTTNYFTVNASNAVTSTLVASTQNVDVAVNPTVTFTATVPMAIGIETSFNWNFGDGTIVTNGAANMSHTYTTPGVYAVSFEGTNGVCSSIATTTVSVNNTTGIANVATENVKVYTNNSIVSVQFGNKLEGKSTIDVLNTLGEVVYHLENVTMKGKKEFDLSTVAVGQYLVRVTSNEQVFTQKVFIAR